MLKIKNSRPKYTELLAIPCDKDTHYAICQIARDNGVSVAEVGRQAVQFFLGQNFSETKDKEATNDEN